jgi:hypothetical protein
VVNKKYTWKILKLKQKLTSEGAQEAFKEILTELKFTKYFQTDGSYNWFMFDNLIQEERVLGLYQSPQKLIDAYGEVKDHFKLTIRNSQYALSDVDRLKRQTAQSRQDEIKEVVHELDRLQQRMDNFVIGGEEAMAELIQEYPDVVEAFNVIRKDGIEHAGYKESKMKRMVAAAKNESQFYTPAVVEAINAKFKANQTYTKMYIVTTLQDIYHRNNIICEARATHILRYFDGRESTRGTGDNKVFVLAESKTIGNK